MANPYRKVRGEIRRARSVRLAWNTRDGEYLVALTKSAALELVAEAEACADCVALIVNSAGEATLDRGYDENDESYVTHVE